MHYFMYMYLFACIYMYLYIYTHTHIYIPNYLPQNERRFPFNHLLRASLSEHTGFLVVPTSGEHLLLMNMRDLEGCILEFRLWVDQQGVEGEEEWGGGRNDDGLEHLSLEIVFDDADVCVCMCVYVCACVRVRVCVCHVPQKIFSHFSNGC